MDNKQKTFGEWKEEFSAEGSPQKAAEITAKFMFAMSYYHDRMRLHIMLHPLFFVAGFLAALWAL